MVRQSNFDFKTWKYNFHLPKGWQWWHYQQSLYCFRSNFHWWSKLVRFCCRRFRDCIPSRLEIIWKVRRQNSSKVRGIQSCLVYWSLEKYLLDHYYDDSCRLHRDGGAGWELLERLRHWQKGFGKPWKLHYSYTDENSQCPTTRIHVSIVSLQLWVL